VALAAALGTPVRSSQNAARDVYRHPNESLSFWGLRPGIVILELWPGAGYWIEILAPYAKATNGSYLAALSSTSDRLPQSSPRASVYDP
jgi:predicted methyltransferase